MVDPTLPNDGMPVLPGGQNASVEPTFSELFAAAVKRRGLALERLRQHLEAEGVQVSIATLSYWQTGRSVPTRARSLRTVEAMERILEVPAGSLTSRTNHYLRSVTPSWQEQLPSDTARQILAEMGYDQPSLGLHSVFTHDLMHVGTRGQELWQSTSSLMKLDRSIHGWPTVFAIDSGGDEVLISISDTDNCRLGEHVAIPELGLFVGELLFHEPRHRGDVVRTGYTVSWEGNTQPSSGFARNIATGLQAASLQVEFEPTLHPRDVCAVWRPGLEVAESDATVLAALPVHGHRASFASDSLQPGVLGLRWQC